MGRGWNKVWDARGMRVVMGFGWVGGWDEGGLGVQVWGWSEHVRGVGLGV